MCIKKIADSLMHAGGRRPPPQTFFRGARGGPSPSLGREINHVWQLTCGSTQSVTQIKKVNTLP